MRDPCKRDSIDCCRANIRRFRRAGRSGCLRSSSRGQEAKRPKGQERYRCPPTALPSETFEGIDPAARQTWKEKPNPSDDENLSLTLKTRITKPIDFSQTPKPQND